MPKGTLTDVLCMTQVRCKKDGSYYNILPKFVNQLITSSIQIIQIDSRPLLSYYKPISLVYYYTGVFCDIWTLLLIVLLL